MGAPISADDADGSRRPNRFRIKGLQSVPRGPGADFSSFLSCCPESHANALLLREEPGQEEGREEALLLFSLQLISLTRVLERVQRH